MTDAPDTLLPRLERELNKRLPETDRSSVAYRVLFETKPEEIKR
jgi:hypothetical protein